MLNYHLRFLVKKYNQKRKILTLRQLFINFSQNMQLSPETGQKINNFKTYVIK